MTAAPDTDLLNDAELAHLMAPFGPFEQRPHLGVAVSGGPDSLALALLADRWARRLGGRVTALTVDHGLRPDSANEAAKVGRWLAGHEIEHHILTWDGTKPRTGIQAAAREARYGLMSGWCQDAGVLHLLLGHHQEDQAETFMLRLAADSGIDGLAAMAAVVEKPSMRLLRPLLNVPKARLRAYLEDMGQPWVTDPSNDDTAFTRVRIRQSLPALAAAGVTPAALAQAAARMARARIALEDTAAKLLATCCHVAPMGYAGLDGGKLFAAPDEISLRALSRTVLCIGGPKYPPRTAKLESLHEKMKKAARDGGSSWRGATLGRCRISACGPVFLICRESRNLPQPALVTDGEERVWDRRFRISISADGPPQGQPLRLANLGVEGWRDVIAVAPETRSLRIPLEARGSLPALWDDDGVIHAPHLEYSRKPRFGAVSSLLRADFRPRQSLAGTGFMVAH